MRDPDPISLHTDPLSEVTRKQRRNLMIASVVGFLVSQVGLLPTRIEVSGIEFSTPSQRAFIIVVGAAFQKEENDIRPPSAIGDRSPSEYRAEPLSQVPLAGARAWL